MKRRELICIKLAGGCTDFPRAVTRDKGNVPLFQGALRFNSFLSHYYVTGLGCSSFSHSTTNIPHSPLLGDICLWKFSADIQKNLRVKVNIIWYAWTETWDVTFVLGHEIMGELVFLFFISIDMAIVLFSPYMQKLRRRSNLV